MLLRDLLLPELDQEMAKCRTMLERVPEDHLDYQPHPKSMTLGRLAGHIAELPKWLHVTLTSDQLDLSPAEGSPFEPGVMRQRADTLAAFEQVVGAARAALAVADDEQLSAPWTLLHGGNTLFTMPRLAVVRSMVLNHIIHHRAQLGVYFRLLGAAVPSTYGPSADESSF